MPLKVAIRIGQHLFEAEGEFDFDVDFWTTLAMWLEALHEPDDELDALAEQLDQQTTDLQKAVTDMTPSTDSTSQRRTDGH